MELLYLDESVKADITVMAGVLLNERRAQKTKEAWGGFLEAISNACGKEINEFHMKDFYRGNGPWRVFPGEERSGIMDAILLWFSKRKHSVVFSAIDHKKFRSAGGPYLKALKDPWVTAAFHCALAVQRNFKNAKGNKNYTLLVFDKAKKEDDLCGLLRDPPPIFCSYCGANSPESLFTKIVDVPYFADSKHVLPIQMADLIAYIIRRHIEIEEGEPEDYPGERKKLEGWCFKISSRFIDAAHIYRTRGACSTSSYFKSISPAAAPSLCKAS